MRYAWSLWAALLILSVPAVASAALYPEASVWGSLQAGAALDQRKAEADFMARLAAAMPEAFGPQLRLRLIIEQNGRGPEMVGLKQTASGYRLVAAEPAAWLKTKPKGPVSRCESPIAPKSGEALVAAWQRVLLATSYADKPGFGGSGDIDHFAMTLEGRWLAGWVYAPEAATPPGRLQEIALTMKAVCMGAAKQSDLDAAVNAAQL
ncbi:MAG: hypothetical protein P4L57_08070 [Rhizomicrobium sp.]|nr:hypothetical protein [Rhizomicrobium sp.]